MKRFLAFALSLYLAGCSKPEGIEPCEVCGGNVSIKATECPHCGEVNPSATIKARAESERKEAIAEAKREEAELRLAIEREKAKPIQDTLAAMEEVRDRLRQHLEERGKLPDESLAKQFAFEVKDAWGYGLQFEYIDAKAGKFRLRSTGDELISRDFVIPARPRPVAH